MDNGIRLIFRAPLLDEAADPARIPTERGWKPGESDQKTVAFTNSFANEKEFQAELAGSKASLANRIKSIDYLASTRQQQQSLERRPSLTGFTFRLCLPNGEEIGTFKTIRRGWMIGDEFRGDGNSRFRVVGMLSG